MAGKYGKKAQSKVKKAMHERKRGTLKSGSSGKKVKSRKQAIAIGLSEARRSGAKVPKKRTAKKSSASRSKSSGTRKSSSRKTPSRKSSSRKSSGRKTSGKR
jgi:hypothetical protein